MPPPKSFSTYSITSRGRFQFQHRYHDRTRTRYSIAHDDAERKEKLKKTFSSGLETVGSRKVWQRRGQGQRPRPHTSQPDTGWASIYLSET